MRGKEGSTIVTIAIAVLLGLALLAPVCHSAGEGEETAGTPAGWSEDYNVSNNTMQDGDCDTYCVANNIYAVWVNDWANIVFSKSNDGGISWTPYELLYNSTFLTFYPDIAVSNDNIHVVLSDHAGWNGIYYRNSTDDGDTWNSVRRLTPSDVDAGNPSIFTNNSNVHIVWHDHRVGVNGQVFYRRSLDGGISFDNGQGLDEDRQITSSPSVIGAVTMAGDRSNISVIWGDERNGDWDLYLMISKDNGFTWEDGLGNVGQDRRLTTTGQFQHAISVNGSNIQIVYTNEIWPGPAYNIYYLNSSDNGATWNGPIKLSGPNSASYAPEIATFEDNIWVMWNDNRNGSFELFGKNSTDNGVSWSPDMILTEMDGYNSGGPRIGYDGVTTHIIWEDERNTSPDIYYKRYPDFPPDPTYNITLNEGWNLISIPLEQRDETIDKVLENITGKWDCIQYYNSTDPDHWKSNATFKPQQLNDLYSLDHKMGFWINITEPGVTLTVRGYIPTSTSIPLYAGWNLVGYPSLNTETVANALWGTGADNVMVCNTSEPYNIKEVGPNYVMKPGEGYWIHVPADTVWVVDW